MVRCWRKSRDYTILISVSSAARASTYTARHRILEKVEFARFNQRTLTSADQLRAALVQVRQEGVAYDQAEQIEGCHRISAPILDQYNYPVAAVWVTGPSDRMPLSEFKAIGEQVKAAAETVSKLMGHQACLLVAEERGRQVLSYLDRLWEIHC
jgi:DNA-binding IclR family transcriptional regulator